METKVFFLLISVGGLFLLLTDKGRSLISKGIENILGTATGGIPDKSKELNDKIKSYEGKQGELQSGDITGGGSTKNPVSGGGSYA